MPPSESFWPASDPSRRLAEQELLVAEHDVTRAVEALADRRRSLPPGNPARDYTFVEGGRDIDADDEPTPVRMRELFGDHPTLLLYSFMFDGTTMSPCGMCTSLVDGFDGAAADLEQRVGFAVVAPAPLGALRAYGRSRGWRNVRLLSDPEGTYSRDSGGLAADGRLSSLMTVFTRRGGVVRHFHTARKAPSGAGQDDRHLDLLWTLWGALDLTPEGRGDWRPNRPARR